jgi:hypothetical protein
MATSKIKEVKISDIKKNLLRPALTSNFLCEFSPPKEVKDFLEVRSGAGFIGASDTLENKELIKLSCSEASLPGSSLATNEINNDYTGVTERHAYRRLYDDRSDFTFYVDSEYRIINREYNYRVNFPNKYKTENLYITKFERDYTRAEKGIPLTYKFINAYPISINSMPVSYDSSQLLKCTVSFTYSRYVLSRSKEQYEKVTNNNKPPKFGTPEWYNTYAPFGSEAWDSLYARNVPEPGDLS